MGITVAITLISWDISPMNMVIYDVIYPLTSGNCTPKHEKNFKHILRMSPGAKRMLEEGVLKRGA
jgi:hypothetical protein